MTTSIINRNRNQNSRFRVPRILLVEDDYRVIASLQRNFHPYLIDLQVAFHGYHGISTALRCRPDVIITDLQMPFASGEELIQCLSRMHRTRHVPIMVITGRADFQLSNRLMELGVFSVVTKPTTFEFILKELSRRIPIRTKFELDSNFENQYAMS